MSKITKEQYDFAMERVEELLPLVDDNTPANDKNAVELSMMSDIVIAYEKEHYPIEKPTVAELIELPFGTDAANCKASLPHIEYTTLCHAWHLST